MNENPINGLTNLVNSFNKFRAGFQGDAQQEVQKLLRSGQMSQQQFNQLQATATQLQGFFK